MRETGQLHDVSTWDQPQKKNLLYSIIHLPATRKKNNRNKRHFTSWRKSRFRPTDPFLYRVNSEIATRENPTSYKNAWQSRAENHQIHGQNNYKEMTQTTVKTRLIRSVKVWNPPQCNPRILDLTPCNTNNSKLKESKDHFRILSTKRSHCELLINGAKITHFTDFQRPCIWTKVSYIPILFE